MRSRRFGGVPYLPVVAVLAVVALLTALAFAGPMGLSPQLVPGGSVSAAPLGQQDPPVTPTPEPTQTPGSSETSVVTISADPTTIVDRTTMSEDSLGVPDNDVQVTFYVSVNPAPESTISVDYTVGSDDDDGTPDAGPEDLGVAGVENDIDWPVTGTLTFESGETLKSFQVTSSQDAKIEDFPPEVFRVSLDDPAMGAGYELGAARYIDVEMVEGVCDRTYEVCTAIIDFFYSSSIGPRLCVDITQEMVRMIDGEIDISGSDLVVLKTNDLKDLHTLTSFDASNNWLVGLPSHFFDGLYKLESAKFGGNYRDMNLPTKLKLVGRNQFVVQVPKGAPFDTRVGLAASNDDGEVEISENGIPMPEIVISGGHLESGVLEVPVLEGSVTVSITSVELLDPLAGETPEESFDERSSGLAPSIHPKKGSLVIPFTYKVTVEPDKGVLAGEPGQEYFVVHVTEGEMVDLTFSLDWPKNEFDGDPGLTFSHRNDTAIAGPYYSWDWATYGSADPGDFFFKDEEGDSVAEFFVPFGARQTTAVLSVQIRADALPEQPREHFIFEAGNPPDAGALYEVVGASDILFIINEDLCPRSEPVERALLRLFGTGGCSEYTGIDLEQFSGVLNVHVALGEDLGGLQGGSDLVGLSSLMSLSLAGDPASEDDLGLTDLTDGFLIPLESLKKLFVNLPELPVFDPEHLDKHNDLQELHIRGDSMDGMPLNLFEGMTNLHTVVLSDSDRDISLPMTLEGQRPPDRSKLCYRVEMEHSAPFDLRLRYRAIVRKEDSSNFTTVRGTFGMAAGTGASDTFCISSTARYVEVYGWETVDTVRYHGFDIVKPDGMRISQPRSDGDDAVSGRSVPATQPVVSVSADAATVAEGGTVTFTYSLSAASGQDIRVAYRISPEAEFDGAETDDPSYSIVGAGVVVFEAAETERTLVMPIGDLNRMDSANQSSFVMSLSEPEAGAGYSLDSTLSSYTVVVTGEDEDPGEQGSGHTN